jgi:glycosyltransferase involved in cell wall biosynthesis
VAVGAPATEASGGSETSGDVHVLALIDHLVLGGAQMLLSQFAAAAPDAGIRMSVACLRDLDGNVSAAPLRSAGVTPVNLAIAPGRPGLAAFRAVRRLIDELRPDVVHTHLRTSDVLGSVAARLSGVPSVSSIHTIAADNRPGTYARRMVVKLCATRIVAVSEAAADAYRSRGWARPGQLVTIHNGVDVTAVPGAGADVRRELGIGADELVIGMVSALRPEKCHDLAIAAVRLLRARLPSVRLVIVGEGPEARAVAALAADLGDRVVMTGHRSDVMSCLDAFDLCLHPSRMEAFPTTLIEALAASVPIVATDVGGIPEIVTDGDTGMLVRASASAQEIAAALSDLLEDGAERARLAAAGRLVYEQRFTVGPWVRRSREMYDEMLAAGVSR